MTQTIIRWDTGITATWYRANQLIGLSYASFALAVDLVEEGTLQNWRIGFGPVQGVRITAEECMWLAGVLATAPHGGGFYEVVESDWLRSLGQKKGVPCVQRSRHFVVCTYEEAIEVAAWEATVEKLPHVGLPYYLSGVEPNASHVLSNPLVGSDDPIAQLLRYRLPGLELSQDELEG